MIQFSKIRQITYRAKAALEKLVSGNQPASPQDGDMWRSGNRLNIRNGNTTEQFAYLSDIAAALAGIGNTGGGTKEYQFSFISRANNVPSAWFGKMSNDSGSNPATNNPTTKPGQGLANGTIDPYVVMDNSRVSRIRCTLGEACIYPNTPVGPAPAIRVSLWRADLFNERSLLANIDIPLTIISGSIGINRTLNNVLATGMVTDLYIPLSAGDTIGLQFDPRSDNNNCIYGMGRMLCAVETEIDLNQG